MWAGVKSLAIPAGYVRYSSQRSIYPSYVQMLLDYALPVKLGRITDFFGLGAGGIANIAGWHG